MNKEYPHDVLSNSRDIDSDNLDMAPGEGGGDERFTTMNLLRARMVPRIEWPTPIQQFAAQWDSWKERNGLVDFTDLIEIALDSVDTCPETPEVIFVDEAQDMSALEMALIRKWSETAGGLVTVGDPDQCLYRWRGSDPQVFYDSAIPADHERILSHSYRVPIQVWKRAMAWINQDTTRRQVVYEPRDVEGEVINSGATWHSPEDLLHGIENDLANDKRVMVLASCSYMLSPIIAVLRQSGIPFHNPYRRRRRDWNPLERTKDKVSAAERVLAYMQMVEIGEYSLNSLHQWTEVVKVKNLFQPDHGKDWMGVSDDKWVTNVDLHLILTDEAIGAGMSGDLRWFSQHLLPSKRSEVEYAIEVIQARGPKGLEQPPKLIVGTIHSVKGGEADVVYLLPDLSRRGMDEWDSDDLYQMAAVYRMFYVGMTRARQTLVLCDPAGRTAVEF